MDESMEKVMDGVSNLIQVIIDTTKNKTNEMSNIACDIINNKNDPHLYLKYTKLNQDLSALMDLGEGITQLYADFEKDIRPI